MKNPQNSTPSSGWGGNVSVRSYAIGYTLSFILTVAAFFITTEKLLSGQRLAMALFALAILQAWIQLAYYFNLGKEPKPRWNLIAFYFMLLILLIIVVGSLLIMYSLNYRMDD